MSVQSVVKSCGNVQKNKVYENWLVKLIHTKSDIMENMGKWKMIKRSSKLCYFNEFFLKEKYDYECVLYREAHPILTFPKQKTL